MKSFTKLFFLLIAISFQSKAQWATVVNENCDASVVPALPSGFTSYPNGVYGFKSDSTNYSDCVGASGLSNIVIRNDSSATGDYMLYFPTFSTIGKDSVHISWVSRVSSHFLDLGSSINNFEFSTNGTDWTTLNFTDNPANSTWAAVNYGSPVTMPATAMNKTSVQLRLNIHIENTTSGTYRLDDITIQTFHVNNGSGILAVNDDHSVSVFSNQDSRTVTLLADHNGALLLFNSAGSKMMLTNCKAGETQISVSSFASGLYFVQFIDAVNGKSYSKKIIVN